MTLLLALDSYTCKCGCEAGVTKGSLSEGEGPVTFPLWSVADRCFRCGSELGWRVKDHWGCGGCLLVPYSGTFKCDETTLEKEKELERT